MENVIIVNNIKKKFKVYYDKGKSLKEKILFQNRNMYEDRWVLKGISFTIGKGEAIGLIGKNGCGKSTILKILSRIIYPTEGNISIKGRVSSLLELGAGFHPDMSGRENIYTNASIFGLSRKEIDKRLDNIINFSELEEFIDNPVRTYSSGMYMRLAFSVAINVDADVLLIDEILAVGDVNFQAKCFEKLKEIKRGGTTIVIVSHSMGQIERICDRCIWIEEGLIREEGIPKFVDDKYLTVMEEKRLDKLERESYKEEHKQQQVINTTIEVESESELPDFCSANAVRRGKKEVEFTSLRMLDKENRESNVFKTGETIYIEMDYKTNVKEIKANFTMGITRDDGIYCYGSSVLLDSNKVIKIKEIGKVKFLIEYNRLLPGKYFLDIGIQAEDYTPYDTICSAVEFYVTMPTINEFGLFCMEHSWIVDNHKIQKENQ